MPQGESALIQACCAYLEGNGSLPHITRPGDQQLHILKDVVNSSNLPKRGKIKGEFMGELDRRYNKLKRLASALAGAKIDMPYGPHVTLPNEATRYSGRMIDFKITGVEPRFGYQSSRKWCVLLVELNIPGQGYSRRWGTQSLHMSIGQR